MLNIPFDVAAFLMLLIRSLYSNLVLLASHAWWFLFLLYIFVYVWQSALTLTHFCHVLPSLLAHACSLLPVSPFRRLDHFLLSLSLLLHNLGNGTDLRPLWLTSPKMASVGS